MGSAVDDRDSGQVIGVERLQKRDPPTQFVQKLRVVLTELLRRQRGPRFAGRFPLVQQILDRVHG